MLSSPAGREIDELASRHPFPACDSENTPADLTQWELPFPFWTDKVHLTTFPGQLPCAKPGDVFGEGKDKTWPIDPSLKELTPSGRQRDMHGNLRPNTLGNMSELQPSVEEFGRRNNL